MSQPEAIEADPMRTPGNWVVEDDAPDPVRVIVERDGKYARDIGFNPSRLGPDRPALAREARHG